MGLTADPASTTGIDCILVQGYMHMCVLERKGERCKGAWSNSNLFSSIYCVCISRLIIIFSGLEIMSFLYMSGKITVNYRV